MNTTKCGIWLDHREAKLIDVTNAARAGEEASVTRVKSGVEDKVKHFGHRPNLPPQSDARSAGSAEVPARARATPPSLLSPGG